MAKPKATLTIKMDAELVERVDEVAAQDYEGNRSVAIRQLLRRALAATRPAGDG